MPKIFGYGVDVSSYQPHADAQWFKKVGADFAIVKLTESTNYTNPYAKRQISGAKAAGIPVHGYHFSHFTESSGAARTEAKFAVDKAHSLGLPKGAIIVLDFEKGQGNKDLNNVAIVEFLKVIKTAGYRPVFYSYSGMSSHYSSNAIFKAVGATTWIAAYPSGSGKRSDTPAFNYFPTVGGHTSAWQFTDNWKGFKVDGSVDLTGIWVNNSESKPALKPVPKPIEKKPVKKQEPKKVEKKEPKKATPKHVTKLAKVYVVKKGDTLSGIARRLKLNWVDVAKKNGIKKPFVIMPGQKIKY